MRNNPSNTAMPSAQSPNAVTRHPPAVAARPPANRKKGMLIIFVLRARLLGRSDLSLNSCVMGKIERIAVAEADREEAGRSRPGSQHDAEGGLASADRSS